MEVRIGRIKLDIPVDDTRIGRAIIDGKFKPVYDSVEEFVKRYEPKNEDEKGQKGNI